MVESTCSLARTVPLASDRIETRTDPPNLTRVARLDEFDWGKCVMARTMSPWGGAYDITQGLGQPRVNGRGFAVYTLFGTYARRSPVESLGVTFFGLQGLLRFRVGSDQSDALKLLEFGTELRFSRGNAACAGCNENCAQARLRVRRLTNMPPRAKPSSPPSNAALIMMLGEELPGPRDKRTEV